MSRRGDEPEEALLSDEWGRVVSGDHDEVDPGHASTDARSLDLGAIADPSVRDTNHDREAVDVALRTIPGRLRTLREVDESGRAVRWILTRGGNLQHAVASIAPIGREARTRCGLQVAPYEHRAVSSSLPRCTSCLERIGA